LPKGHYEVLTVGWWGNSPIFVVYDNLSLYSNADITLDERLTHPVTIESPGKVFAEVFHGIISQWICPPDLGWCFREGVGTLYYYPDSAVAYYSYSEIMYAVDRYVFYPVEDINPSAPDVITTSTWYDLLYIEKGISSSINRTVNISELVMKYTEYRTAAAPKQSAAKLSWAWREVGAQSTFVWLMNVPYKRVEVVSPNTYYYGFYQKYRDIPGVSTPYWEYYGWINTAGSGSEMREMWGEQPLFQTVKYVYSYDRGDGTYDIYLGAETFTDFYYYNTFHARYPLDELYIELYRDGQLVPREEYYAYAFYWWWGDYYIRLYNQTPPAKYALNVTAREYQTLTTETRLYYEFKLNSDGTILRAPTLTNIDIQGLTLNNTLNKPAVNVIFELYNQSNIQAITFEYSIDDGKTWLPLTNVLFKGLNIYTASFTLPGGRNYVSLRINATDANGLRMSITMLRSFFADVPYGYGLLRVQTIPPVCSTIYVNGIPRNDWGLDWVKMPEGSYSISFTDVPGFITPTYVEVTIWPDNVTFIASLTEKIPIYTGKVTEVKAYFIRAGYLKVEVYPPTIIINDRKYPPTIYVNGEPMNDYGLWVQLKPGNYTVSFQDLGLESLGFFTPPPITVEVKSGYHVIVIGNYTSGISYVKEYVPIK